MTLDKLQRRAEQVGIARPDVFFVDDVQCSADVRYGEACTSREEAVRAHHASLELTWYLVNELRERQGLPQRAL